MGPDVFLSYEREDKQLANSLVSVLRSNQWSVFWDRDIPTGENWRNQLQARLREARCVLVLWTTNSITSNWVREEAQEAVEMKKILPVSIDGVDPPIGFRNYQTLRVSSLDFSEIVVSVREMISRFAIDEVDFEQSATSPVDSSVMTTTDTIKVEFEVPDDLDSATSEKLKKMIGDIIEIPSSEVTLKRRR